MIMVWPTLTCSQKGGGEGKLKLSYLTQAIVLERGHALESLVYGWFFAAQLRIFCLSFAFLSWPVVPVFKVGCQVSYTKGRFMPRSHQAFRSVLAMKLLGIMLRIGDGQPLFSLLPSKMPTDGVETAQGDRPLRASSVHLGKAPSKSKPIF